MLDVGWALSQSCGSECLLGLGFLPVWWHLKKQTNKKLIKQTNKKNQAEAILGFTTLEVTNAISMIHTSPPKIKGGEYGTDPTSQWGSINVTL